MEFQKQLAYELIKNDYLEKEEAASHRRSTRIQEGIGHGLLSLPPFKTFVATKVVTSSKYPPKKCNYCKREVCTYCRCTPGVHLCSHCLAEHIHDADNEEASVDAPSVGATACRTHYNSYDSIFRV